MKRLIRGQPYVVEQIHGLGWRVTAAISKTDNLHRSYLVQVGGHDGRPMVCSCPDHQNRGRICKHMQEVERVLQELEQEEVLQRAIDEAEATTMEQEAKQPDRRPFPPMGEWLERLMVMESKLAARRVQQ